MHPLLVIGRRGCSGPRPLFPRTGSPFLQWKSHKRHHHAAAIVVGGGPAGIAAVGNLLTLIKPEEGKIVWVDNSFNAGRINTKYREVPSNTKALLFSQFATAVKPFREICEAALEPNALTELRRLPQTETCSLHYAGDVLKLLTNGLANHEQVSTYRGLAVAIRWDKSTKDWSLAIRSQKGCPPEPIVITRSAPLVVFCTGAVPKGTELPVKGPRNLHLDYGLKPSLLAEKLPQGLEQEEGPLKEGRLITVGVIGASHSAILVLKNLWDLQSNATADSPLRNIRVKWFTRHTKLKYAIYEKQHIIYDNTGLKGTAAKFARRHLDGHRLEISGVGNMMKRVDCSGGKKSERKQFKKELPGCDYVIQAIGFVPVALPRMQDGPRELVFDDQTGGFRNEDMNEIPGLFGAGIAFPELVKDVRGNIEWAVGMWKFMKFLKRVVPKWVGKTRGNRGGSLAPQSEN